MANLEKGAVPRFRQVQNDLLASLKIQLCRIHGRFCCHSNLEGWNGGLQVAASAAHGGASAVDGPAKAKFASLCHYLCRVQGPVFLICLNLVVHDWKEGVDH
jgi:hypothetical protein